MTPEEVAWAAGLFEGEGCIKNNPKTRMVQLSVVQKERWVLDRFAAIVGVGKVYGPYRSGAARTPLFSYHATRAADIKMLYGLFRPWLSPRRVVQAEKAFALFDARPLKRAYWINRKIRLLEDVS